MMDTPYHVASCFNQEFASIWSTPIFQPLHFLTMSVIHPKNLVPQMPNPVYIGRLIKFKRYKEGLLLQWKSCIGKDWPQISAAALNICSQPAFVRNHCIPQLLSVFSQQQHCRHMACPRLLSSLTSSFCSPIHTREIRAVMVFKCSMQLNLAVIICLHIFTTVYTVCVCLYSGQVHLDSDIHFLYFCICIPLTLT